LVMSNLMKRVGNLFLCIRLTVLRTAMKLSWMLRVLMKAL
jgi:hypothetical protein